MGNISNEVIRLLNRQNEAAYELVFNLFYPRLVYFAKEYVPYDDAKNLVQDAFVALWNKKPEFLNKAQLQSFLYTSVKNNCIMYLRHEKVKKSYGEDEAVRKQNQVYTLALEQIDTSHITFQEIEFIVEKTLGDLPPRCREVFILSRMEGKKNQEVAEALEISVKSVEAQITKALKLFRIALKDYLPLVAYLLLK